MNTDHHRCRCRHTGRVHNAIINTQTDEILARGACSRPDCRCWAFTVQATPWCVRRDSVHNTPVLFAGPPWRVESPRGVEVCRARSQRAAVELAHTLASVEEMLARVARLERTVHGDHPVLRASARPLASVR